MSGRRASTITEPEVNDLLQSRMAELKKLQEVELLTGKMRTLLDSLYNQINLMEIGTDSVANITSNWIQIVRAVSLAANSMMVYNDEDFKTGHPTTERLVRCALDDLGNIINDLHESHEETLTQKNEENNEEFDDK
ncbi:hypothetical protein C6P40_002940 [Pichia californica]|uniref:DASH complex subunit DAD2 n=1 Tax=Pichia californica TaxID=460514 RepID=A0A9P6WH34_9ASCO|nr:hypothetical protein C6P42_002725 [[Candida] californica]KAG0687069.1 hypothetical protein C6P40_002940 [[Candida] californica]